MRTKPLLNEEYSLKRGYVNPRFFCGPRNICNVLVGMQCSSVVVFVNLMGKLETDPSVFCFTSLHLNSQIQMDPQGFIYEVCNR